MLISAKNIILVLIGAYQKIISPDHGLWRNYHPFGFCRFHPSCSEYTRQAIKKYGLFKGIYKGTIRILKCNPFSKGGIDQVI